jgi:hypothetical protein
MGGNRTYLDHFNPLCPPILGEVEGKLGDTPKPPPKGLCPFGIPIFTLQCAHGGIYD